MKWILLLLIVFSLYQCKNTGSLSLYHFSGTTFLNLQRPCQPFSFKYKYDSIFDTKDEVSKDFVEMSKSILKPKQVHVQGKTVMLNDTIIGNFQLEPGEITSLSPQAPPNGHQYLQSWINKTDHYPSHSHQVGNVEVISEWISSLEKMPVLTKTISIAVHVPFDSELLRNLMVNFYREENRNYMKMESHISTRASYQSGFLELLLDVDHDDKYSYNPSMEELYNDFVIRQVAENITGSDLVWKKSLDELVDIILKSNMTEYPVYGLDITPILLSHFPNHPISQYLDNFIKPSPVVEFNEFTDHLDLAIKRACGFVKVTQEYGPIVADSAISQISHINLESIRMIRSKLLENKQIIFKYIVRDPETCPEMHKDKNIKLQRWYERKGVILGFIESGFYGISPLIIPGDSIAWHQRTEHRFNILAKFNPALINFNLAHAFENKWFETLFWNHYCPNTFLPKTKLLMELLPNRTDYKNVDPKLAQEIMNRNFPQGYAVKGVWDYCSMDHVISQKSDIPAMSAAYKASNFGKIVSRKQSTLLGCEAVEDLKHAIRHYKLFKAWKVDLLLSDASETFMQEWQSIEREYRIECAAGHCPEWRMGDDNVRGNKDSKTKKEYYKHLMNSHFVTCIDSLPEHIRGIPLTSDVALTTENKVIVFETNPGGNSWFIHNSIDMAGPHNEFLGNYSYYYTTDPKAIHHGMTPQEQMEYLTNMLKLWKIDLTIYAPRFTFLSDRIINNQVFPKGVNLSKMNYTGSQTLVEKKASHDQMMTAIQRSLLFLESNLTSLIANSNHWVNLANNLATFTMRMDGFTSTQVKKIQKVVFNFEKLIPSVKNRWIEWINTSRTDDDMLNVMEMAVHLKELNLLSDEIKSSITIAFDKYLQTLLTRWKQKKKPILFDFNHDDDHSFYDAIGDLNHGKRRNGLKYMSKFLGSLFKMLSFTQFLENSGYDFPIKSFEIISKWRSPLIRIYKSFLDENMKKSTLLRQCFGNLALVIHRMILIQSNKGQIVLNFADYADEFAFLKRGIKLAESVDLSVILGYLMDSVYLINGQYDKSFQQLEPKAHFYMVYRQRRNGSWHNNEEETDEDDDENGADVVRLESTLTSVINFIDRNKQFNGLRRREIEMSIPMYRSDLVEQLDRVRLS